MNATFGDPKDGYPSKALPTQDRALCIEQVTLQKISTLETVLQYAYLSVLVLLPMLTTLNLTLGCYIVV